jgi:hypothetical protein
VRAGDSIEETLREAEAIGASEVLPSDPKSNSGSLTRRPPIEKEPHNVHPAVREKAGDGGLESCGIPSSGGNASTGLPIVDDVRSLPSLWPLRQRRHAVIACVDEPAAYEAARDVFAALRAELIVENEPGPLSRALGRPSVTVADRFGSVGFRSAQMEITRIVQELEGFELACPECGPQAWGDPSR